MEENHKVVDIIYAIVNIGYVVQYPRFMDIDALQNKITAKSRPWPLRLLSGYSLSIIIGCLLFS